MNLTRRQMLAGLTAAPLLAQKKSPVTRPNVVLVIADDLAAWMLGCYGNQEIRTPNIDLLARAGVRFQHNYVCTPSGSPSRATLLTGRTPRQHGIQDFLTGSPVEIPPQGQAAAPASFAQEVMLSDMLSAAGYRCGYVGRWDMGNDTKPGHSYSYTCTIAPEGVPYNDPVMYLNGEEKKESGYLAELITRRAAEFIDQQSPATPFLLTVGYLNPHTPYEGQPKKYYDLYANTSFATFNVSPRAANALRNREMLDAITENTRKCAAAVTALDDQIAVLQKKIFDKKFFDNTIVIFCGSNGQLLGRHGLWGSGLASNPINMYEESVAVPMIWSWPGLIPVESVRPELISEYDFLPTVADAVGVKPPARNLCGRSYLTAAVGRPFSKKEPWRDQVFGQYRDTEMVRDKMYKLVLRNQGEGPSELFDLRTDSHERINVYADQAYVSVREALTKDLADWRKKTSS
jgi:choline-sulfatase